MEKFLSLFPMKSKSDSFACFKLFRAMFEKTGSYKILALRTDNGGEYMSTELSNYLSSSGIKHEPGPPHSPQLNGVAERTNRTINNLLWCGLVSTRLPNSFWANSLRHIMHTYNSVTMNKPVLPSDRQTEFLDSLQCLLILYTPLGA